MKLALGMHPLLPLTLPLLLAAACSADETNGLGGTDGAVVVDTGVTEAADATVAEDATVASDVGFPLDADIPPGPDGGPPPPADGGTAQCRTAMDCFRALGRPPLCEDGTPGNWGCTQGLCELVCEPATACQTDCDCPFELACARGQCAPLNRINQCCLNPACPPGSQCINADGSSGMCEEAPPPVDGGVPDAGEGVDGGFPPTVPVGAPCMDQVDCAGGFCLDENTAMGFTDGYCTQQCGPSGMNCPVGATCQDFGPQQSFCLDECGTAADCRTGYQCVQLGLSPSRVCFPTPPGSTNPNGDPVGSACVSDNDCEQGLTCLADQGWPGGYCTVPYCDPQTNPCPTDSSCFAFPGSFSLCLADCPAGGSSSTCRAGYYCFGPSGQQGGCIPN